jgi:hypothetical protein
MADIHCLNCGYTGPALSQKRGTLRGEIIAWLSFPLGIPYSLWRMLSRRKYCPSCKSRMFVSADSRAAQGLFAARHKAQEAAIGQPPQAATDIAGMLAQEPLVPPGLKPAAPPAPVHKPADPDQW